MNIKEAKTEIKHTVKAYVRKDEKGRYVIPAVHQRPVLLIGPPGIGKTAIMEQIAKECGIGLVAYTITHHTRQSAIGLPVVVHKNFQGREYTVTEYTMSEIVASVYDRMEETGCREGILFIDEINCVSETLSPAMLQLLQCKTFGTHKIPEGWVIVAAGNPPEYNKSVREFDIATLDRVKKIDVEADFGVWKEYGYAQGIHPCILSYLNLQNQRFYHVENTALGKYFVTARGWEDLSQMLYSYEEMGIEVKETLALQYLQEPDTAADFSGYYQLYQKYRQDYAIGEILDGSMEEEEWKKRVKMASEASVDERLTVAGLILSGWNQYFAAFSQTEEYVKRLYEALRQIRDALYGGESLKEILCRRKHALQVKREQGMIEMEEEELEKKIEKTLKAYSLEVQMRRPEPNGKEQDRKERQTEQIMTVLRERFEETLAKRKEEAAGVQEALGRGFGFAEEAFGEGAELTLLVTDLSQNPEGMKFIGEFGCEEYFVHSQSLMFERKRQEILRKIEKAAEMPETKKEKTEESKMDGWKDF